MGRREEWRGIPIVLICMKGRGKEAAVLSPSNFPVLAAAIMPTLLLPPLQHTTFSPPPSYPTAAVSSWAMFRVETVEYKVQVGYMTKLSLAIVQVLR